MTLTNKQRNIVNPNAPTYSHPEGTPVRSGVGYSYTELRNRFVLDVIHESYNSYYEFPPSGFNLFPNAPIPDNEEDIVSITTEDLLAYCALYPQNGKVGTDENGTSIILALSVEEANRALRVIISNPLSRSRTGNRPGANNYYTDTAPVSFDPENTEPRYRLISIDPNHSAEYVARLRRALGKENEPPLNTDPTLNNTILPPEITSYISSDATVDLDNWIDNCNPGTETIKTYYNARESVFYYTERTNNTQPGYYDLSYYDHEEQEDEYNTVKNNLQNALNKGVEGILKSVGKFSQENKDAILNVSPKKAYILTNLDIRPASRWCYCVQIERGIIESLPEVEAMSYEEEELWVLEKAQTLASPEKTPIAHRVTFVFDDLVDYLRSTRSMLELLNEDMTEEGIFSLPLATSFSIDYPNARSGLLFLEDEMARLTGFPDYMQTFFAYNKRALLPETVVELFFDESYRLLHICADGELLIRGLGNQNYIRNDEEEDDDEDEGEGENLRTILNAFSFLTSTTFSYIRHSREIHEKFMMVAPGGNGLASGEEWTIFLPKYTYPQVIIDPDAIKVHHETNSALRRRKKTLFQRLSRVLDVPPEQAEKLYQAKLSDKNWVRQRVTELVKGVNCSTAQAQIANDIIGFWNAANEKNNVRAIIRESIQLLRRELSNDAVTSIAADLGLSGQQNVPGVGEDVDWVLGYANRMNQQLDLEGSRNPNATLGQNLQAVYQSEYNQAQLIKQVEEVINDQIFCAIDSFGNILQNGFLDPLGLPPSASRLVEREIHKPLTVKLSKVKTVSMKKDQSEYYWKIIDTAIQQLLKSLITGIARDVFAAALGCAPNASQADQLDNPLKRYDFGYSMLSDYVGDVNLRDIAINSGLVTPPPNEGEDPIAPTPVQLQAFLKDISMMCTPAELQQLLFGEADNVLYDLIHETVSNGNVTVKIGEEKNDDGDMVPVNYIIQPGVYASLIKTKDVIREFFAAIGVALLPEEIDNVDEMSFQSPLEAYCAGRDPDVAPLRLRVGMEQLQGQYLQIMDARINKINSLCQWLQDLSNIEAIIGDIFENLPLMEWYNTILELIANFSNYIANMIAELWSSWFDEDPSHSSKITTSNFYNTRMGAELFYQMRDSLQRRPQHTVMTHPIFFDDNNDDGQLNPAYILGGSNGTWGFYYMMAGDDDRWEDPYGGVITQRTIPDNWHTILGNPYLDNGQIRYQRPIFIGGPVVASANLDLPYQPPSYDAGYIDMRAPGGQQFQTGYYSLRVAPFSYRESIYPELVTNPGRAADDAMTYGTKVMTKMFWQSWYQEPYVGFISPVFLQTNSINNGGYKIKGIKITPDSKDYVDLASYVPDPASIEYLPITGSDSERESFSGQPFTRRNTVLQYALTSLGWDDNNDYRPDLVNRLPSINNRDVQILMNHFFAGYIGTNADGELVQYSGDVGGENIYPLISIGNWWTTTESLLNSTYYNETGKRRMPQYVNAINRDALKVLDDKCVTRDDARKAHAILKSVQSRMQKFFLNAMINAPAYPCWNNLSTRKIVCDYLSKNVIEELTARSLLGLVYENIDLIRKVYADEPENNFELPESNTPYKNLRLFIEALYIGMLNNIAKYSEYDQINKNVYYYYSTEYVERTGKDNVHLDRYMVTLETFFTILVNNLRLAEAGAGGNSYGLSGEEIPEAIRYIDQELLQGGDTLKYVGNYYFPIGVLIATHLIYADFSLNTAGRYSQTNYRLQLEEAGADDGLITAFRGVTSNEFSVPYRGFPQTVLSYTQTNEILYYNSDEVRRRLSYINGLIVEIGDTVENFDMINFSPEEMFDMDYAQYEEIIWPVLLADIENTGLDGFDQNRQPIVYANGLTKVSSYDEALDVAKNHYFKMLSPNEPGVNITQASYVGWGYALLFGTNIPSWATPDEDRQQDVVSAIATLQVMKDISPGTYTPSRFYESFRLLWSYIDFEATNTRRIAGVQNLLIIDADSSQAYTTRAFLLSIEGRLSRIFQSTYTSAAEEGATIEDIRTERNSLEKLIIE